MFSALLLTFFVLVGSGCTENKLSDPQPSTNAPRGGEIEDAPSEAPFIIRHPEGIWTFNVISSRFWLRKPDELPKPTSQTYKSPDEPAASDDMLFSVRSDGSNYYGFPYLRVRVIRPSASNTTPLDFVLGDIRPFEAAGYPLSVSTTEIGDVILHHYARGQNELVFVTHRQGFIITIEHPFADDPQNFMNDVVSLVRGFETLPEQKAHVLISLKEPSSTETILDGTYPASCSPAPWDEGVSGAFRASFDGYELDVEENPDPGVLTLSYARGITLHTPTGMRYGKIWDSSTHLSKDENGILVRARLESQYSQGSSLDLEARFTCT